MAQIRKPKKASLSLGCIEHLQNYDESDTHKSIPLACGTIRTCFNRKPFTSILSVCAELFCIQIFCLLFNNIAKNSEILLRT